ncbi:TM0106 family RecB-like putative nuclease, partial [Roseibium sp. RKSG952]|uniref:TM0106 family RecB-like putative nuclease n=1 Tax=Roseibium sp. RKSG952 TaxID=2529384 RepID=UPI0012BC98A1
MKKSGGGVLFSASDLMRFSGCSHATVLDLAYLNGEDVFPCEDSEDARLLQGQGDAHEAAYLEDLKRELGSVVEIDRGGLKFNAEVTETALREGRPAVFQGAFLSGNWGGWSDFLIRVEKPSALGTFSYEVIDTKLKRSVHPKHVLQLALYSDLLASIQGVAPEMAHVLLGDGRKVSLRLADYQHYARSVRQRFERFVEAPVPTRPVPCSDCGLCRWRLHCDEVWQHHDSLYNIANVTRGQVRKLEAVGLKTMEAVACSDGPVRGMAPDTLDRLRAQARLQHARKSGAPAFEFRPHQPGKGFDLLPEPRPGDVFYDIEGDPYFEGGLEYLHGLWFDGTFKAFWAHDHKAEAESLAGLLDFFRVRLEAFPQARIYHYAPYEVTALRRLTTKYGIGEAFLDKLQTEQRFVDLYAVVRGCLIASEPNYSIKSMEVFYDLERVGEVKTAGGSVIAYEAWRDTRDQAILDEIEDYNRIDCVSTEKLRDWLVSIRPHLEWPVPGKAGDDREHEEDEKVASLRALLAAANLTEDHRELLFNLGMFHRREVKPGQWAVFDSISREDEELLDDLDALGGLVAKGPAEPVKRSFQRIYAYPPQETKLRAGKSVTVSSSDGAPS